MIDFNFCLCLQRTSNRHSDTESVGSSSNFSRTSRQSYRVSQVCRCKNGCKSNRCGCLKAAEPCSSKCICRGRCSDENMSALADIVESNLDSDSCQEEYEPCNELNRTFTSTVSDDAHNKTFTNFPNIDDDDKENMNNLTITDNNKVDSDATLTQSFVNSNNLIERPNNTTKYFDSPFK